jgi:hypothetical protein
MAASEGNDAASPVRSERAGRIVEPKDHDGSEQGDDSRGINVNLDDAEKLAFPSPRRGMRFLVLSPEVRRWERGETARVKELQSDGSRRDSRSNRMRRVGGLFS